MMNTVGICPACRKEIIMQAICPNCKFNIEIFEKAKKISIYLYNEGLKKANEGKMLDAISTLEKSLELYKNNIVARNLLGILYYQIGEVTSALKQWVISSNIQKDDNVATRYLAGMNKEKNILNKKNEAIKTYNEAIGYVNNENIDIAIIRLLKAINLSPEFLKAYLLLMLCYYKDPETKEKAKAYLEKAKQIDKGSSLIKYYIKEIAGDAQVSESEMKQVKKEIKNSYSDDKSYFLIGSFKLSKYLITSVVSIALTLVVVFYLGGLDAIFSKNMKLNESNKNYKKEISEANSELESLKEELNGYKSKEKKKIDKKNIDEAYKLIKSKNYEKAYNLISDVDLDVLDSASRAKYEEMKPLLVKEVSRNLYLDGKELFEDGKYDEALVKLEKSLKCASSESFSAEAMYYVARVYEKKGKEKKAREMYSTIINEFQGTHVASQAKFRQDSLNDSNKKKNNEDNSNEENNDNNSSDNEE